MEKGNHRKANITVKNSRETMHELEENSPRRKRTCVISKYLTQDVFSASKEKIITLQWESLRDAKSTKWSRWSFLVMSYIDIMNPLIWSMEDITSFWGHSWQKHITTPMSWKHCTNSHWKTFCKIIHQYSLEVRRPRKTMKERETVSDWRGLTDINN